MGTNLSARVQEAYVYCEQITRRHYENFPVASLLLGREKRRYLSVLYAFARAADDLADEGTIGASDRLLALDDWQRQLDESYRGSATHPVFIALIDTIEKTGIPREPLADLIRAFRTDVTTTRFPTFPDLLSYCRCSANPVGRLVLHVFGDARDRTFSLSDDICTALQLTNFWQDVAIDREKGRIYIPLEDFDRFGYTETDLAGGMVDHRFRALMEFEVMRTRELFSRGSPLVDECPRELRLELSLTLRGGRAILDKIASQQFDVLACRPSLSRFEMIMLAGRSLVKRIP